jgi:uncharacterized protein YjiS (DUF1127 family)
MALFTTLRDAAARRAAYRRTVFELQGLSGRISEDVGIYPGDEKALARQAVYG